MLIPHQRPTFVYFVFVCILYLVFWVLHKEIQSGHRAPIWPIMYFTFGRAHLSLQKGSLYKSVIKQNHENAIKDISTMVINNNIVKSNNDHCSNDKRPSMGLLKMQIVDQANPGECPFKHISTMVNFNAGGLSTMISCDIGIQLLLGSPEIWDQIGLSPHFCDYLTKIHFSNRSYSPQVKSYSLFSPAMSRCFSPPIPKYVTNIWAKYETN